MTRTVVSAPPRRRSAGGFPSFRLLEALSFTASAIFSGLLIFWLGVTVAVVGGVGPFAGTLGFLVESRRRRRVGAAA